MERLGRLCRTKNALSEIKALFMQLSMPKLLTVLSFLSWLLVAWLVYNSQIMAVFPAVLLAAGLGLVALAYRIRL